MRKAWPFSKFFDNYTQKIFLFSHPLHLEALLVVNQQVHFIWQYAIKAMQK